MTQFISSAWESFKSIPPYWSNIISLVGFLTSFALFWLPRPKFVRDLEKKLEKEVEDDFDKEKKAHDKITTAETFDNSPP